jgi:hypothetical protein
MNHVAADEIERLREELRYYACDCNLDCEVDNRESTSCGYRARKALGEKE